MPNRIFAIIALVLLGACAGEMPVALRVPLSKTLDVDQVASWMAADAFAQDLLYVSDLPSGNVYVFSFPVGEPVGTLAGFEQPLGECVNRSGDVFITDGENSIIAQYAHGAAQPKHVLSDPGSPVDCSVDRSRGDLAVANFSDPQAPSYQGNIAVYSKAKGKPRLYSSPDLFQAWHCAYDDHGNLFVVGKNFSLGFIYMELPKGKHSLKRIKPRGIRRMGAVEWDGKYIAVRTVQRNIERLLGTKVVGTTVLRGSPAGGTFWIQNNTAVVPTTKSVGLWRYPRGGKMMRTIGAFDQPYGVVVSIGHGLQE